MAGGDRKSKEKSRKRSSSSASEDIYEGKGKRLRTGEDKERERGRSDKKEKRKGDESKKKSKDRQKDKRHKGDRRTGQEFHELSADDYFSKNKEFATWLKEEKNVFFSDLSSESSRELFSDFVKAWNKQKLESRYYEGISTAPRTSHNWKIKH